MIAMHIIEKVGGTSYLMKLKYAGKPFSKRISLNIWAIWGVKRWFRTRGRVGNSRVETHLLAMCTASVTRLQEASPKKKFEPPQNGIDYSSYSTAFKI